jgi:hypothetical protein
LETDSGHNLKKALSHHIVPTMPGFLELPVELRLDIYDFALQDSCELTIATTLDVDSTNAPSHIPGLPAKHVPVIRNGCDRQLLDVRHLTTRKEWSDLRNEHKLSITLAAPDSYLQVPAKSPGEMSRGWDSGYSSRSATPSSSYSTASSQSSYFEPRHTFATLAGYMLPTSPCATPSEQPVSKGSPELSPYSLLETCRFVHDELGDYISRRKSERLVLNVSYPYGILVLWHQYPALLAHVKALNIHGFFNRATNNTALAMTSPSATFTRLPLVSDSVQRMASEALDHITAELERASILNRPADNEPASAEGNTPKPTASGVERMSVRMLFAGDDAYSKSITDDDSPWSIVSKNLGGDISMQSFRGKGGCAWIMDVDFSAARKMIRHLEPRWSCDKITNESFWLDLMTGAVQ